MHKWINRVSKWINKEKIISKTVWEPALSNQPEASHVFQNSLWNLIFSLSSSATTKQSRQFVKSTDHAGRGADSLSHATVSGLATPKGMLTESLSGVLCHNPFWRPWSRLQCLTTWIGKEVTVDRRAVRWVSMKGLYLMPICPQCWQSQWNRHGLTFRFHCTMIRFKHQLSSLSERENLPPSSQEHSLDISLETHIHFKKLHRGPFI